MKFCRIAIALIAVLLALSPRSVVSQEAVNKESTPSSEETPAVEIPKETSNEKASDEISKDSSNEKTGGGEERAKKEQSSEREASSKVLQDMMTAEEFKAAGLEKLSTEELKNLNAWLQGFREVAETKAAEKATAKAEKKAKLEQTLSRVDGTFTGLTGRTIIKLEDGSRQTLTIAIEGKSRTIRWHSFRAVHSAGRCGSKALRNSTSIRYASGKRSAERLH